MQNVFYLFLLLTVLPLLLLCVPACMPKARADGSAAVKLWWGLCLAGTALWGLALVVFSDGCFSFGEQTKTCVSQLDLASWLRTVFYAYVPLGGVAVPALWFMVFYAAVRRAQRHRELSGQD